MQETIKNLLLHVNALRTEAHLAGVQKGSLADSVHRFWQITIGKNDGCILSAEFKGYRFDGSGHRLHDGSPGLGLSRKRDGVHVGVLSKKFSRRSCSESVNDVIHTMRNSRFLHHFRQKGRRRGRFFRWLHHDAIPARQRWSHFPRQQQQRKIPGRDDPHHPKGFPNGIVQSVFSVRRIGQERFQGRGLDQISEDPKVGCGTRNIQFRCER